MTVPQILRIYLDKEPRARALAGEFNIMSKIQSAFEGQGYRVEFARNSEAERAKSESRRGYSLFHMDHPFHRHALTLRRAYFYPFWRIEASAERWEWPIATQSFDPDSVDAEQAASFANLWRRKLFPKAGAEALDGSVYVPLQGRLLEKRRFQTESPLDMIRAVLAHDQSRQVVVSLHPSEAYLPEEREALLDLIESDDRLTISTEPMGRLLPRCDYVVTQNSSAALFGYFLQKPSVLFARIDFPHIAANVIDMGAEEAIRAAPDLRPAYDKYLHWFIKQNAINGGAPDVEDQILEAVRRHGWIV